VGNSKHAFDSGGDGKGRTRGSAAMALSNCVGLNDFVMRAKGPPLSASAPSTQKGAFFRILFLTGDLPFGGTDDDGLGEGEGVCVGPGVPCRWHACWCPCTPHTLSRAAFLLAALKRASGRVRAVARACSSLAVASCVALVYTVCRFRCTMRASSVAPVVAASWCAQRVCVGWQRMEIVFPQY